MKSVFDNIARKYDTIFSAHVRNHYLEKRLNFIRKHLKNKRKILDVGCGTGLFLERLTRYGFEGWGIDNSIEMVRIANNRNPDKIFCADSVSIPFSDESFDGVICIATLHHINDFSEFKIAIEEMIRVLKDHGYILIWDHNPLNLYWRILMERVPQDSGEERLYSSRRITEELRKNKVKIREIKRMGIVPDFTPENFMPLVKQIESIMENIPLINFFMAHNVILGEKNVEG